MGNKEGRGGGLEGCRDFQDEMLCKSIGGSMEMGRGVAWVMFSILRGSSEDLANCM